MLVCCWVVDLDSWRRVIFELSRLEIKKQQRCEHNRRTFSFSTLQHSCNAYKKAFYKHYSYETTTSPVFCVIHNVPLHPEPCVLVQDFHLFSANSSVSYRPFIPA